MVIHEFTLDNRGAGRWEINSTRYVPMAGGSRSRLPIASNGIRRYYGFVGIDEKLTESVHTMAALYHRLGGGVPPQPEGSFVGLLLTQARKWMEKPGEPEAEAAG